MRLWITNPPYKPPFKQLTNKRKKCPKNKGIRVEPSGLAPGLEIVYFLGILFFKNYKTYVNKKIHQ